MSLFPHLPSLPESIARMADVIGPTHVGLGSDVMGLVGASALPDYRSLPDLAAHLLARYTPDETAEILGGGHLRAARLCMPPGDAGTLAAVRYRFVSLPDR